MKERYIKKRLHDAEEYESKGKIESAIGVYEELGGDYLEDGISVALQNGLLKKCIGLLLENNEKSRAKLVRENVKYNSRNLQKYLVKTLKRSKLSIDLHDPILGEEMVDKKEFEPYISYTDYKN